jgi:Mg-chelatase subunit ChlD
MDPNHTLIVVILDASGSMEAQRDETIGALNHFFDEQRNIPGRATLTLVQFAYVPSYIWRNTDLAGVRLTRRKYEPRGGTALLDAMGSTIDDTGRHLRSVSEAERPGKVIILTMTDGQENASHGYSKVEVAKKIEHQRAKYDWQFLFLGADMATINEAREMGIASTSTMSWEPGVAGGAMRGMVANVAAVNNYRLGYSSNASYVPIVNHGEKKP